MVVTMGWLARFRRRSLRELEPTDGPGMGIDLAAVYLHFADFAQSRRGVEAYLEPGTSVSAQSMVLVATDGEWTRRAVGSRAAAYDVTGRLGIPVYDVLLTGYPPRMREWSSRQRRGSKDSA